MEHLVRAITWTLPRAITGFVFGAVVILSVNWLGIGFAALPAAFSDSPTVRSRSGYSYEYIGDAMPFAAHSPAAPYTVWVADVPRGITWQEFGPRLQKHLNDLDAAGWRVVDTEVGFRNGWVFVLCPKSFSRASRPIHPWMEPPKD